MPSWKDLLNWVPQELQKSVQTVIDKAAQGDLAKEMLSDPRVSRAVTEAFKARGVLQDGLEGAAQNVAKSLGIATETQVRELKRTIRKLEEELKKRDA